jgi:hypothetical protein
VALHPRWWHHRHPQCVQPSALSAQGLPLRAASLDESFGLRRQLADSRLSAAAAAAAASAARSFLARAARARFNFCLLSFMLTFLRGVAPALGGGGAAPTGSGLLSALSSLSLSSFSWVSS